MTSRTGDDRSNGQRDRDREMAILLGETRGVPHRERNSGQVAEETRLAPAMADRKVVLHQPVVL